jgi:hypothetical protein
MRKAYFQAVAAVILAAVVGCGDKTADRVGAMNRSNIQRIGNMYAAYQNYKAGRGPQDETDLKEFIKTYDPGKLTMMKIDPNNLGGLFTSERDGKPFKIRYQVSGGRGSAQAVIFEQDGQAGKKQVGFTGGRVEEVEDATYDKLWAGGETPSASPSATSASKGSRPVGIPPGAPTGPPGR